MKILGREPALLLGFVAAAVKMLGYLFNVSGDVQTAINAIAAGVVAVILAIMLRSGALGAAIMQVASAVMALIVGLGLDWSADKQALVMAVVSAGLALFTRTQVTAPVTAVMLEQSSPVKAV
jgi:hypothetical protein